METSGEKNILSKYNLNTLPEEGSEWVGKFFNEKWEEARKEKIGRLGMHKRAIDLHASYRGRKRRRTYPRIGINHLFKIIESYCATLTEKVPVAEFEGDDADDSTLAKALDQESQDWWQSEEQQFALFASTKSMQIYGTVIEKGSWNIEKQEPEISLRDFFNIFPCPGYKMCELGIPYFCDVDFLEDYEIRSKFGIDESITIPSDVEEQIAGTSRETMRGGKEDRELNQHYAANYAPSDGIARTDAIKDKTLIVEIWIQDKSVVQEPIIEQQEILDDMQRSTGQFQEVDTGEISEKPRYIDGIRKITICPALLENMQIKGVLDDSPNPSVNWNLLEVRINDLITKGLPQPVMDKMGQPAVDPQTGQPIMQPVPLEEDDARTYIYDRAKMSFPYWGQFPYSVTPARIDTSQWWGFSIIEQLEEMQGKIELMLTKYFTALERQMFPLLVIPQGSNLPHDIDNSPGQKIEPTVKTAPLIRYVEPPQPPTEYLDAIYFLMQNMDLISMRPDVAEGRRPTGVSAASAIIALQDKASTLMGPQIQQVDKIIRNRGRLWAHFKMNFDTTPKQIKVDDEFINFKGIDIFSKFKFNVESGSSAPITKAGRRQQFVELRKIGDMDRLSLLENLDIPNAKLINERLTEEESVPGALKILVEAGLPIETAQQLHVFIMQDQFKAQKTGGTSMERTPEQRAGGYSEGMNNANNTMSDLRES